MNNDARHSNYAHLSPEMIQRYIEEAQKMRSEAIACGFRRTFAGLGNGVRQLCVRLSRALRAR